MHARDQRAAAFVVVDQVELPERVRVIERRGRELAGTRLQRGAGALPLPAHELLVHDMAVDVEVGVVDPARAHRVLHRLLAEAAVLE